MYNEECRKKGTFKAPLAQQISYENKSFVTNVVQLQTVVSK